MPSKKTSQKTLQKLFLAPIPCATHIPPAFLGHVAWSEGKKARRLLMQKRGYCSNKSITRLSARHRNNKKQETTLKTQKITKTKTKQPWELPASPKRLPDPPKTFPKPSPDPSQSPSKIRFLREIAKNTEKVEKNHEKLPTRPPRPSPNPSQIHFKSIKKPHPKTH